VGKGRVRGGSLSPCGKGKWEWKGGEF